jgi:hypothetical protein
LMFEKKPGSKISWHCPFKELFKTTGRDSAIMVRLRSNLKSFSVGIESSQFMH